MKYLIIILETILIILYIKNEYGDDALTLLSPQSSKNSAYYSLDFLEEMSSYAHKDEDSNRTLLISREAKEEMLSAFPNMELMLEIVEYETITLDDSSKKSLLDYIVELQNSYIGGEIDEEGFKKELLNAPF